MSLAPYRSVLAVPGVRGLTLLGVLARVPHTAMGVVLTIHVVQSLGHGYGAAGAVVSAMTVGMAVGAPWRGRAVDRVGLRRAVLPSVIAEAVVWGASPFLPFPLLLPAVAVAGLLGLPIFTVTRLGLAALVPPERRRTAFALDSVSVELSFMIGPVLGVLVATQVSTRWALAAIAVTSVAAGLALLAVDPPVREVRPDADVPAPGASAVADGGQVLPARVPVTALLLLVLAVTATSTVVLAGTDVSIVAHLREVRALGIAGLVAAVWAGASLVGGLVYGALRHGRPPLVLLLGLGVLTVPAGLAPGSWWLALTVVPAGLLCAPVMTATSEAVTHLVPERARGEAMGWHGSALTAGVAAGAPLAGAAIDRAGAWAGFAVVGAVGAALAVAGLAAVALRSRLGRGLRPARSTG